MDLIIFLIGGFFLFKQKTAYEMRISDWSSDVCSSDLVEPDLDLIVLGEMGIANSTAAAALCARSFGGTAADWVGPGTGVGAEGVTRKVEVVERALAVHAYAGRSAFETLRRVGGRETAAIAGAAMQIGRAHV